MGMHRKTKDTVNFREMICWIYHMHIHIFLFIYFFKYGQVKKTKPKKPKNFRKSKNICETKYLSDLTIPIPLTLLK